MATIQNDRDNILQAASVRDVDPTAGKYLTLTPSTPVFHVSTSGTPTPSVITITANPVNMTGIEASWSISAGTLTGTGNTRTLNFTDMPVDNVTVSASVNFLGQTYNASIQIAKVEDGVAGETGADGDMFAVATLYKWSTVEPSLPSGSSTFTWASAANTSYLGSDGWFITVPTNPGTSGIKLWTATKPITAPAGTPTTTVTYSAGATVAAISQNGVAGAKQAIARAYQWSTGPAPTTTGTATWTWSSGTYDNPPATGWTASKTDAPALGYTLYEATVALVDSTGAATTSIDWTTATRTGIGYVATNGNNAAIAYVLVDGNSLNSTPASITKSGTALPANGDWGSTRAWQSTPPTAAAGQSVFQSNGIWNSVSNQTVWGLPYLSALRVGNLSAIATDTGTLNVSGTISSANGNFTVDNNGNATMKALTVRDSGGNILIQSSASTQITTTNVGNWVQAGAIGNTQFGGDLFSTNWSGGTGVGATGWYLQRTGNLYINQLTARGAVMGGSFTGYAWPASGQSGFYLGSSGLLIGNANDNKYFQVEAGGNVYAPGFSIVNGNASFTGAITATSGSFSGTLNAPNGTLGTITSGTIQSGSSGQRTVINQNGVNVYDSAGTLRVRLGIW
jgi:hypothetical protein